MNVDDQKRADFYAECWQSSELSASEQEAILLDRSQHQFLKKVWDSGYDFPDWLSADSIPGHTLVDVIAAGKLSIVCRAISDNGQIHCVKVANYREHPDQVWEKLEASIRNEACVLRRLPREDLKFGKLPNYICSGEVTLPTLHGRSSPYLITQCLFGLKRIELSCNESQLTETWFWIMTARLLGEVHRHRIVHGDIHEGNLFLDSANRPVLLDFGNSQVRKRFEFLTRSTQRHFGPAVAMHADEVASPHDRLSPAYDVMCLMEVANGRLKQYFEKGDWQRGMDSPSEAADRYQALLRVCRAPAPEYRPADGNSLAASLQEVASGSRLTFRPVWWAPGKVFVRRYPRLLAAATLLCTLMLLSIGLLISRQIQLKEAAGRDAIALERLRASNAITIGLIQDFLAASSEQDELLEEVSGTTRRRLGERIETLLRSDVLTFDARVATLAIGLKLTNAVMELDGWEAALPIARLCVEDAKQIAATNQGTPVRLFKLQAKAILSKALYLVDPKSLEAKSLAMDSADGLLRVSRQGLSTLERVHYCEAAIDVSTHALYPQRSEAWFKNEKGERLWLLLTHAIEIARDDQEKQVTQFAELQRLFGLAMHKGAFFGSSRYPSDVDLAAALVQDSYHSALEVLSRYEEKSGGITARQARQIKARVNSVLGMSYTNQGRYAEAQAVLHDAFAIRDVIATEFPGSLRRQREFISTGWNYADAIRCEATLKFELPEASSIHRREISIRSAVVQRCQELLTKDRNSDSEEYYLVNATRLAIAYAMLGDFSTANEQLLEVENYLGLDCLEYSRIGLGSVTALSVLSKFNAENRYVLQLEHCIGQINQSLEDTSSEMTQSKKLRFEKHSRMFIHAANSVECIALKQIDGWDAFLTRMDEWQKLDSE